MGVVLRGLHVTGAVGGVAQWLCGAAARCTLLATSTLLDPSPTHQPCVWLCPDTACSPNHLWLFAWVCGYYLLCLAARVCVCVRA